jgi:hypothetical protein
MLKVFPLRNGALIVEIHAMSASKTVPVVSTHGGLTAVEEGSIRQTYQAKYRHEAPHDLPLALPLGCEAGE